MGKLITSLASVGARTGIWIVADASPEHVAAVSWLNETSRASFYLLGVEAFRIDNSPPAPVMGLITGPEPAKPGSDSPSASSADGAAHEVPDAVTPNGDAHTAPGATENVGSTASPAVTNGVPRREGPQNLSPRRYRSHPSR